MNNNEEQRLDIIARLRDTRIELGLTQTEVGKITGIPPTYISVIESGTVDFQLSRFLALVHALELEVRLVPLNALSAVDDALRSRDVIVKICRALDVLEKHLLVTESIKVRFPDLPEVGAVEHLTRAVLRCDIAQMPLEPLQAAAEAYLSVHKTLRTRATSDKVVSRMQTIITALNAVLQPPAPQAAAS